MAKRALPPLNDGSLVYFTGTSISVMSKIAITEGLQQLVYVHFTYTYNTAKYMQYSSTMHYYSRLH
jgi:hypothetical protein